MINQFRVDRDFAIQIIWNWNIHVENYNSLLKDLEKIEKNRQVNRKNVNLLRRENKNVNKFNVEVFKLNKNKQKLLDELNILRMNFTTTSIFSHVDKFKTNNVKFVNRNIE